MMLPETHVSFIVESLVVGAVMIGFMIFLMILLQLASLITRGALGATRKILVWKGSVTRRAKVSGELFI